MHPFLLHFPPVTTYGACIVAGLIAAWLWARRRARSAGHHPSHIDLLLPVLIATGLLGAWLFGVWTDSATGDEASGTVLIGALALATTAGIFYALIARIPLGILGDICAPPLALGIGIGRVGCFFAGCCFGKPCNPALGIRFPPGSFAFADQVSRGLLSPNAAQSLAVYPTQLLESVSCLLLAIFLARIARHLRITGEAFLLFAILYPTVRFFLEFLRADNPPAITLGSASLTFSQAAAFPILFIALFTWLLRLQNAPRWRLLRTPDAAPGCAVRPWQSEPKS